MRPRDVSSFLEGEPSHVADWRHALILDQTVAGYGGDASRRSSRPSLPTTFQSVPNRLAARLHLPVSWRPRAHHRPDSAPARILDAPLRPLETLLRQLKSPTRSLRRQGFDRVVLMITRIARSERVDTGHLLAAAITQNFLEPRERLTGDAKRIWDDVEHCDDPDVQSAAPARLRRPTERAITLRDFVAFIQRTANPNDEMLADLLTEALGALTTAHGGCVELAHSGEFAICSDRRSDSELPHCKNQVQATIERSLINAY